MRAGALPIGLWSNRAPDINFDRTRPLAATKKQHASDQQAMILSWIPILYAMLLAACLTLASVHFLVWRKVRSASGNLLFSAGTSLALPAMVFIELSMMQAQTAGDYGELLRWLHVPVWLFILVMVSFVLLHLRTGRWWLGLAACALRTMSLALDFLVGQNLNFLEITQLQKVSFLGEIVSVPVGVPNPLMLVGQASLLVVLIFVADAMRALWRRGDRRLALVFGVSLTVFVVAPALTGALVVFEILPWPVMVSPYYAPVMAAMSYEMSRNLVRSDWLAGKLQATDGELRRSEQRLKMATESARLAIWEWNIDHDEIWATTQGLGLFGIPPGEPINFSRFLETVHAEDRDGLREEVGRSRANGEHFEREYRVVHADGQTRWVASRGQFNAGSAPGETVMRGVLFDITEAKWAQEQFHRVVETSPIAKLISGPDGRVIYANPVAEAYFGYPPAELLDSPVATLLPAHRRAVDSQAKGVPHFVGDVVGQHRDGREIPLQMSLSPLPGPQGNLWLTTLVDISERKQREEQLWKEKNFLRQVIDINPCLIFVKDREGRFTLANKTVAALYGTTPRELIGRTDTDFNSNPDEVSAFRRDDRQVLTSNRELVIGEESLTDVAGKRHWLQTIKRPLVEYDGTISQVLGVSTDITARKLNELEIERQRNELAHLSRVTMLSELSGSLAHELNQPLAAILANAQAGLRFLAQDKPDIGEISDILHDIVDDDRHAGGVIQGLRLMLKKGQTRQESVDLNEAVRAVLKLVRSDLLNADVSVSLALLPDLPNVRGYRVQLQQVLLNLVVNGSEAMAGEPVAGRQLVVSTDLAADGLIQVAVADRGHGIPPENLEQVFDPFVTTKAEGLGLGLAVCRRIIEAHGGRLWASNNAGPGACFRFTVPADLGETP